LDDSPLDYRVTSSTAIYLDSLTSVSSGSRSGHWCQEAQGDRRLPVAQSNTKVGATWIQTLFTPDRQTGTVTAKKGTGRLSRGHRPAALLDEPWDNQNHKAPPTTSQAISSSSQVEGATRRIACPPSNTLRAYISSLRSLTTRPSLPSPLQRQPSSLSRICSSAPCAQKTLALDINHISATVANDEGLQYEQGARHHQEAAHL